MRPRPICEPVVLPLAASARAAHVAHGPDAPALGRLRHFHDLAELVLFEAVCGHFWAGTRRIALTDGAIAFVPSMHHHDFDLAAGSKAWHLVQIDPYLVERLARQHDLSALTAPFAATPAPADRVRLAMLAQWLGALDDDAARAPLAERLVEALLLAAAAAPRIGAVVDAPDEGDAARLLPALARLRAAPGEPLPLTVAAAACNLSPAYFCRRFRATFGMRFTDYARDYRLHLAARRLLHDGAAIATIGYAAGFATPSHFTASFRARFGVSPRQYRAAGR